MRAVIFASAVALALSATLASAQTMSMPTAAAAGPTPAALAAAATVPSTKAFVETAAAANQFEIVSSQLALTKTKNKKIVAFAKKMIKDHTQIGKNYVAALGKANTGITPPAGLGDELDKIMARLKSEEGATFEADYIAAQTKGHQDAVGLFAGYAKGGDNKVVQAFAKKTLPMIEMHLQMCYELAAAQKK
ncbi:DUF4142 domain-containing protein [Aquabacter sp. CN5-332]|uniref:DUF4142 domain-containing protein n=1 Tax=Aquabacter sp. CN5-332 TaxID=3156608 RepID=UPI0032B41882